MAERRLRLANSSPDVKALFNAPAYLYNLEPQEPNVDTFSIASDLDYWTPTQLVPIVCSIFNYLFIVITIDLSSPRAPECLLVLGMLRTRSNAAPTPSWKPS